MSALAGTASGASAESPESAATGTIAVPRQAWRRALGLPYEAAGRPRVTEPMIDDGPWGALPLGGLGAGGIGRTHAGDFRRWHVRTGTHHVESRPRCGFGLRVARGDEASAWALVTDGVPLPDGWGEPLPVGAGTYAALFPRAWFEYRLPDTPVRVEQLQYSPVLPHDYDVSSWPVGVFEFRLHNDHADRVDVALLATWDDLVAFPGRRVPPAGAPRVVRESTAAGFQFSGAPGNEAADGSWALLADAAAGSVTVALPVPASAAGDLWADFAADGALDETRWMGSAMPAADRFGALAVHATLAPGESRTIRLALAWDLPLVEFGAGTRWWRRHTRTFGRAGTAAATIAQEALRRDASWRAALEAWQRPLLDDPAAPDWYVCALLNELYVLVDGGTLWADAEGEPVSAGPGRFAFLECYDYPFYNTYDVLFYASWALLALWPELERSALRDLSAFVALADETPVPIETSGAVVPRKAPAAAPHDAGAPFDDPLRRPNAYRFRDVNRWKDLNAKFVLQLWRDRVALDDASLVSDAWPAVVAALDRLAGFDADGDGLPDHDGTPDQTFDTWPMSGPSAYGGGLWLAALSAAAAMAAELGDADAEAGYRAAWQRGRASLERLWNGRCFDYDGGGGPSSDSVMADQLCGIWYADACGLPAYTSSERVLAALRTIHDRNVLGFADGTMGAVNGTRPGGEVDDSAEQSAEVWPGVTYALAALMFGRGLAAEAWSTARGAARVTYERGYWFRTPEAWDAAGNFRASMYMRPLSIWALEEARTRRRS